MCAGRCRDARPDPRDRGPGCRHQGRYRGRRGRSFGGCGPRHRSQLSGLDPRRGGDGPRHGSRGGLGASSTRADAAPGRCLGGRGAHRSRGIHRHRSRRWRPRPCYLRVRRRRGRNGRCYVDRCWSTRVAEADAAQRRRPDPPILAGRDGERDRVCLLREHRHDSAGGVALTGRSRFVQRSLPPLPNAERGCRLRRLLVFPLCRAPATRRASQLRADC